MFSQAASLQASSFKTRHPELAIRSFRCLVACSAHSYYILSLLPWPSLPLSSVNSLARCLHAPASAHAHLCLQPSVLICACRPLVCTRSLLSLTLASAVCHCLCSLLPRLLLALADAYCHPEPRPPPTFVLDHVCCTLTSSITPFARCMLSLLPVLVVRSRLCPPTPVRRPLSTLAYARLPTVRSSLCPPTGRSSLCPPTPALRPTVPSRLYLRSLPALAHVRAHCLLLPSCPVWRVSSHLSPVCSSLLEYVVCYCIAMPL